jgi:hypothetical protein
MRFDGLDEIDREQGEVPSVSVPLDAAESAWDPWLWALYLREIAAQRPPNLH